VSKNKLNPLIGLRLPEEHKKRLEVILTRRNNSLNEKQRLTDVIRELLHLWEGFDDSFWKKLKTLSRSIDEPVHLVLQNITIDWVARRIAKHNVDRPATEELFEFRREIETTDKGVTATTVTGEMLEQSLIEKYTEEFEKDLLRQFEWEETKGRLPETDIKRLKDLREKHSL